MPPHPHRRVKQLEIHSLWRKLQGKDESESEVAQSCLILWDPMDCSLPGFSIHGIFQARVLEWVTISFSRRSSRPRGWTWIPHCRQTLYRLSQSRTVKGGSWALPRPHISHSQVRRPPWSHIQKGSLLVKGAWCQETHAHTGECWDIPNMDRAVCAQSLSRVWLFVTPWTIVHEALLSMGFSRQKYWSG